MTYAEQPGTFLFPEHFASATKLGQAGIAQIAMFMANG
jgi:hypothetical protein